MRKELLSRAARSLRGEARVPGDKSISHRALMLAGLAVGETVVSGLLEGEDVLRTAQAMRAMGCDVERTQEGRWRIYGRGVAGLAEPEDVLDMGNAGTGSRLLLGILAGHPFTAFLTGDASLRARPMRRVIEPLSRMGATFHCRSGGRLPLAVRGTEALMPIAYRLPVPSAQVKSAVLLAGLAAPGETSVIEAQASRDHTEHMLRHFGVPVRVEDLDDGGRAVTVTGQAELAAADIAVPADPSSAAFPAVAALIVPDSDIRLPGVGINPLRFGLFDTLREMGADIAVENRRRQAGEPVADLVVRSSELRGIDVPPERAPSMIDEYPILAVAAACASGTTRMRGLSELRVKESDRLAAMARGLAACGVAIEESEDGLVVHGRGRPLGGARIEVALDHRIAMAFLVLGLVAAAPVTIDDSTAIATSFPGFKDLMNGLGAAITEEGAGE